jgi:polyisoprenoid-binding protein YceI
MSFARSGALLVLLVGTWSMANNTQAQLAASAIDAGQSSARFIVHLRISMRAEGELTQVSGELRGTPSNGWQVLVDVDGHSLRFDGPHWMERITRSEAFLAVDRFPGIRFNSEQFSDTALHAGGPLHGELTLRGLTRPVSFQLLPSICVRPGRDCDIQVQGTISRHAFGMNAYRALVKDEVDFNIRVRLQAQIP